MNLLKYSTFLNLLVLEIDPNADTKTRLEHFSYVLSEGNQDLLSGEAGEGKNQDTVQNPEIHLKDAKLS